MDSLALDIIDSEINRLEFKEFTSRDENIRRAIQSELCALYRISRKIEKAYEAKQKQQMYF